MKNIPKLLVAIAILASQATSNPALAFGGIGNGPIEVEGTDIIRKFDPEIGRPPNAFEKSYVTVKQQSKKYIILQLNDGLLNTEKLEKALKKFGTISIIPNTDGGPDALRTATGRPSNASVRYSTLPTFPNPLCFSLGCYGPFPTPPPAPSSIPDDEPINVGDINVGG